MKNVIKLLNYEYPGELKQVIGEFVEYPRLRPGQATTGVIPRGA